MKKLIHLTTMVILVFATITLLTNCSFDDSLCIGFQIEDCNNGWGILHVENKSLNTVQQIIIDNTNYGSIDPEECKDIDLPVGKFTLEFRGISGGSGCNPSEATIPECGVINRSCSY